MNFFGKGGAKWGRRGVVLVAVSLIVVVLLGAGAYAALGGAGRNAASGDINLQKGLVGWWKMDGNAKDFTPYSNNGTVTGATSVADRKGKANSAYSFDGSTSVINAGNAASLNMGTSDWTTSAWIKSSNATTVQYILNKRAGGPSVGYNLTLSSAGKLLARFDTATSAVSVTANGTAVIADGTWHLVTATYQRSGNLTIYVDGVANGSVSIAAYAADNIVTTNPLYIGEDTYSHTSFFNGSIDDARVYQRAISAAEVSALYNQYDPGLKAATGASGLLGEWKLDGNAKDSEPTRNNGTVTAATLTTDREGRANSAYTFDGTSALISAGNPSSLSVTPATFTWSAWIYPTNVSKDQMFLSKQSSNYFRISGSKLFASLSLTGQKTKAGNTTLVNNTWYHVAVTYDGSAMTIYLNGVPDGQLTGLSGNLSFNTGAFEIGRWVVADPRFFVGKMDDVRVYSRALSTTEIAAQAKTYNSQVSVSNLQSGLVGDWPMNGNAKDATPYRNLGTLTAAVLTADRKGRASSAYSFDGTTSYITAANSTALKPSTAVTVSAWINTTNLGATNHQKIVSTREAGGYYLGISGSAPDTGCTATSVCFAVYDGTTYQFASAARTALASGVWQLLTGTYDGTTIRLYLNGTQIASTAYAGTISESTAPVCIGAEAGPVFCGTDYFAGTIDDVRIWNRALSTAEIAAAYQEYR
jgi:hypothetical protein